MNFSPFGVQGFNVWNYDPISRGLKLVVEKGRILRGDEQFGTMTRFLGD